MSQATPAEQRDCFTVFVDEKVSKSWSEHLKAFEISQTIRGLYSCTLVFQEMPDPTNGYPLLEEAGHLFGKALRLSGCVAPVAPLPNPNKPWIHTLAGPKPPLQTLFDGRITNLDAEFTENGTCTIRLTAQDRLLQLRGSPHTRTYQDFDDDGIIRQILGNNGLSADVQGAHLGVIKTVSQVKQDDLSFLQERCELAGLELWADGATVRVAPRSARISAPLALKRGDGLFRFQVLTDPSQQPTRVTAVGWSRVDKDRVEGTAELAIVTPELNGGRGGSSVRTQAFGNFTLSPAGSPATNDEARVLAESTYRRCARRFVVGRGVAAGRPELRVGAWVQLSGIGTLFGGQYYVSAATQRFDLKEGWRVEFEAERPYLA